MKIGQNLLYNGEKVSEEVNSTDGENSFDEVNFKEGEKIVDGVNFDEGENEFDLVNSKDCEKEFDLENSEVMVNCFVGNGHKRKSCWFIGNVAKGFSVTQSEPILTFVPMLSGITSK